MSSPTPPLPSSGRKGRKHPNSKQQKGSSASVRKAEEVNPAAGRQQHSLGAPPHEEHGHEAGEQAVLTYDVFDDALSVEKLER